MSDEETSRTEDEKRRAQRDEVPFEGLRRSLLGDDDHQQPPADTDSPGRGDDPGPDTPPSTPTTDRAESSPDRLGSEVRREDSRGRASDDGSPAREAPLGGLNEEIRRRRDRGGDDLFERAFAEVEVESVQPDAVWERLSEEEPEESEFAAEPGRDDHDGRAVRVVDKRAYCQGCRYFSAPPIVSCTHEGTEIVELVDVDHFRVVDCPVVEENERLAGTEDGGRRGE